MINFEQPPEVSIAENVNGTEYGLLGWQHFDEWARRHKPIWARITSIANHKGIQDEDRIKLLAYGLMRVMHDALLADIKKATEATKIAFMHKE